ncbi:4-(cytidine 5'-diphospho)-2-C-methyl-D-erythritol kinase [Roseibium sp.]|uniref:4-(cytidine 5'-diphospho)-2-C-methyl-D-erythritol kinase n=1 Tax=Roseibium sp. TaxID=1936156 RepID=UPI003A968D2B
MTLDTTETTSGAEEFAPAKVNLALHITGQRADGYHLLDSLVVFPRIGDRLTASKHQTADSPTDLPFAATTDARKVLHLTLEGPFGSELQQTDSADNLVIRAFQAYCTAVSCNLPDVSLRLQKNLPVASGIGGGSADAAAALRLAARQTGRSLPSRDLKKMALTLGADVPVCLTATPMRMSGIGDILSPLPPLPAMGMVLINPGVGVSTPAIFKALDRRDNPPLPKLPPRFADLDGLMAYLLQTRNDMQEAAEQLCPAIADVICALEARPHSLLARMSGSGATCFALTRPGTETTLATDLRQAHPSWWITSGLLG